VRLGIGRLTATYFEINGFKGVLGSQTWHQPVLSQRITWKAASAGLEAASAVMVTPKAAQRSESRRMF